MGSIYTKMFKKESWLGLRMNGFGILVINNQILKIVVIRILSRKGHKYDKNMR